jgi:hypothetical protein
MAVRRIPVTLVCAPRSLPNKKLVEAARIASTINPVNHPPIERLGAPSVGSLQPRCI